MHTQTLLTSAGLVATSVAAVSSAAADQIGQALSKVNNEAESIALQNTVAANAVYSWQAEQTAVSASVIQAQNDDYFNAYLTATATGLPAYVTAVPTSLQPYVSSLLAGEATLVMTEVAPIISSLAASASVSANSANSTTKSSAKSTAAGTFATSGMPSNSANSTDSKTTSTPGSSSTPPNPPQPKSSSGADRNGVLVAAGVVGVGLAGLMSLL